MYETKIKYHPLTGNVCLTVDEESFFYEEDGVGSILTLTCGAIIHTRAPQVYCR